ncbi:MAG: transglycosylase domain-containing protein, partial [Proteobacteria bacterium]|nr:transglycosylase domain-containing protein [Pseudomonadota bacterium]
MIIPRRKTIRHRSGPPPGPAPSEPPRRPRRLQGRTGRWLLIVGLSGGLVLVGARGGLRAAKVDLDPVRNYRPSLTTTLHADDGRVIAEFYRENRRLTPLDRIPRLLQDAFLAAEDATFRHHRGVSYRAIIRAMVANLRAGRVIQGGSTITQQLVKLLLLSPKRTFSRKLREVRLAYALEKKLSKDHILFVYLNHIYLGHGAYGVATAAENYFRKPLAKLNLAEMALLAGLTRSPGHDSPPDCLAQRTKRCRPSRGCDPSRPAWLERVRRTCARRARQRQLLVLGRMLKNKFITPDQYRQAKQTVVTIWPRRSKFQTFAPYFAEYVRRYLVKKYGRELVETGGLEVHTTLNVALTRAARRAMDLGLRAYDQRHGFRGPMVRPTPAAMKKWAATRTDAGFAPDQLRLARISGYDPKTREFAARIGAVRVVIPYRRWQWARRLDRDFTPPAYKRRRRKGGRPLHKGDLVLVRLLSKDKNGIWQGHLSQELMTKPRPEVHAALVSIRAGTGHVKVLIGGRSWQVTQLDRATHPGSIRQPGSAFKPFVYATALSQGFSPGSTVVDEPVSYPHRGRTETWKPQNYDHKYLGPITLRRALKHSRNVPAVKVLVAVGPKKVAA